MKRIAIFNIYILFLRKLKGQLIINNWDNFHSPSISNLKNTLIASIVDVSISLCLFTLKYFINYCFLRLISLISSLKHLKRFHNKLFTRVSLNKLLRISDFSRSANFLSLRRKQNKELTNNRPNKELLWN